MVVGHDGHSPVPLFGDEHTEEEWARYLEQRAQGVQPDVAAASIGLTGTQMRAFLKREPWRLEAVTEHYQERLKSAAATLALDVEKPNPRILEVELATHVPGYEHLRRDRVKHEGHVTHGVTIALDPETLDALPVEERRTLRELLLKLGGDLVAQDAEFTEVRELTA